MTKKSLILLVFVVLPLVFLLFVSEQALANTWAIGNIVGLCANTEIRSGSGFNYPAHTIVPENDWAVKIIDGPRFVEGKTWWDISRKEAGDPSGGTGWVYQSQADVCLTEGGGGDDGGSGSGENGGSEGTYNDGYLETSLLGSDEPPPLAESGFIWPLDSPESPYIGYGDRDTHCGGIHHAKDFYVSHQGDDDHPKVYAVADGKVVFAGVQKENKGYGTYIIIWHVLSDGRSVYSLYAHLFPDTIRVTENQFVHRGDWIARQDTSGKGANEIEHLHFELRKEKNPENPCPLNRAAADLEYYDPMTFIPNYSKEELSIFEEASLVTSTVAEEAESQQGTIDADEETDLFSFLLNKAKQVLTFVLNFPGSTLEITIYRPDGSVYGVYETSEPPLLITIPEPAQGEWRYSVRAIDVPYANYPYVVSVGMREELFMNTGEIYEDDPFEGYSGDLVPPSTTISSDPPTPNGNHSWYITPVNIYLNAIDDPSGVGLAATRYSLNEDRNFISYDAPFMLTMEGQNTLTFFSIDGLGNQEAKQTKNFKIDLTPPVVNVSTDQIQYTRIEPFTVHYSGFDPEPGSGLMDLGGMLDRQIVEANQLVDLFGFDLGSYTLLVTGEDYAGWTVTNTVSFELIATLESLHTTVERFCDTDHIDHYGTCRSLQRKLAGALAARDRGRMTAAVNILNAFQNQVEAQKGTQPGKSIPHEVASILLMDSNYVITQLSVSR